MIIDLSSNNPHPINYAAVKAAGVQGVIIKATDGTGYVNPYFTEDVAGFNAVGVPTLGYHYAEFGNPQAEAAHFMAIAGPRARVLDVETNKNVAWQNAFLVALNLPGNEELDYGSASTLPRTGVRSMLWPASYGKNYGYGDCWQYTDAATVPGISGKVDGSAWIGSQADFDNLFSLAPPPVPKPTPNLLELFTMNCVDPTTNGTWIVDPTDGHIECMFGAPYLGGLNSPADRYGWQGVGYISGITPYLDANQEWGYAIIVRHSVVQPNGAWYSSYGFQRDGSNVSSEDGPHEVAKVG